MLKNALRTAGSALRTGVLSRASLAPTPFTLQAVRAFAADAGLSKSDVTDRVMNVVKGFNKVEASKVTPTATFTKDLGLDSLDTVEVVMAFEEEFMIEIPDAEADKITSCEDAITYLLNHPLSK